MKRIQFGLGKHLIIDAYGIEEEKIKDLRAIRNLLRDLPKKFKMRPLSDAVVKKVASDYYPNYGISGFIMLYESHISIHTWPEQGYAAIDVYSCKDFNAQAIIKYLKKYWNCKRMKIRVVIRG
ncbi:adenosylmethionine decarboxylase [Candidatus Wolfebacteria bacterium]|nr:adenosylmethionine decarboxylase [Candidatus Wolfebacteria bacterium]